MLASLNPLGIIILVIFGIAAWVMIKKLLPALLTLPIMALAMVLAAALYPGSEISLIDITNGVIRDGSLLLKEAIMTALFGGILSFIMQKSGVAESLVKHGAELIGDNPFAVALFSMALVALLFTSLGGLGAVIMVSMVVLPMLATVGIQPVIAGGIMLIGISLGGALNAGNWVLFKDTMGVPLSQIKSFALIVFFLMSLTGVLFIAIELYRGGTIRSLKKTLRTVGIVAFVGVVVVTIIIKQTLAANGETAEIATGVPMWLYALRIMVGGFFLIVIGAVLVDIWMRVPRWRHQVVEIKWYAYLIPVFPLALILLYDITPLASFFFGFLYAILVTMRPGSVSLTIQSMIQGSNAVMPAVLLMVTIGLLINAVKGPGGWSAAHGGATWPIIDAIQPFFTYVPTNRVGYVLTFGIAAPLALYRGPFNTYGLGFGIATVLVTAAGLPQVAVMGMLLTVGQIQGVSDPTNTVNVWLANELRVDVQALMWRTLPYIWGMVFVGLAIASLLFLGNGVVKEPDPMMTEKAPIVEVVEESVGEVPVVVVPEVELILTGEAAK